MENEKLLNTNESIEIKNQNKRLIGLDILKILSMFFIIIHHFSKHGGFYWYATGFSKIFYLIINCMFLPSVNIFVFVSAYLIVKKNNFKLKRLFYLYFEIIFFAIFTYLLNLLITNESFSFYTIFAILDPFNNGVFWFTNAYMLMYALTPLLLLIVNKLNKKNYFIFICILLLVTIFCQYTNLWNILNNGFSYMWFVFLFFFAGYQAKFGIKLKKWIWLVLYIPTIPLAYFFIPDLMALPPYTSICAIVATFALFNLFKDITIQNKFLTKTISIVVSSTLGIYLLHDSGFLSLNFYNKVINTSNFYTRPTSILWFFLFVVSTFIVCLLFDIGRKYVCKLFLKMINRIKNKINNKKTTKQKDTV